MAAVATAVALAGALTVLPSGADGGPAPVRDRASPSRGAGPTVASDGTSQPSGPPVPAPEPSPTRAGPRPVPDAEVRTSAPTTPDGTPEASDSPEHRPGPHPAEAAAGPLDGLDLYRHPRTQALEWLRSNPGDRRRDLIDSRIAQVPVALWFTSHDPGAIRSRVRAVTAAAEAQARLPVLVPYVIPHRDCGGASGGGAPSHAAYDGWMREFAAGLGGGPVIVVLEPDSLAMADCLPAGRRADRYASLARAARALKAGNARARVYFDAGSSAWHPAAEMARVLRAAGAVEHGDGVFTNVSQYHRTEDEAAYARAVLAALGAPARHGAVIDTGRNGNGPPVPGPDAWCDPPGRGVGQPPTTGTGADRIDAYLWVKPPGESDGCRGLPGAFSPDYAYELASGGSFR
ncbi:glycoside hydrolase family 6 protein [Streptomyces sp. MUM 203J]|nr:glycoside hydrolase family 6 protein [Streptomyces sp. MUM 203J]